MLRDIAKDFRKKPRRRACSGRTNALTTELHKQFLEANPKIKIDWKTFKNIIVSSDKLIINKVAENRDGFEMPKMMGYLFIASCPKPRRRNVDFNTSIELGKIVYHKNWDTDGQICKIFYTNYGTKYKLQNRELWRFTGSREFNEGASKAFKLDHTKYIAISRIERVSKYYKS